MGPRSGDKDALAVLPPLQRIFEPLAREPPPVQSVPTTRRGGQRKARWRHPLDVDDEKGRSLQRILTWRVHKQRHAQLAGLAQTDWDRYVLTVTNNPTSPDFLFVRLTNPMNRMRHTFKTSVRLFLGLPVAFDHCNIADCSNTPVATNGQHPRHAPRAIHKRHNAVRDEIGHFFRILFNRGSSDYEVHFEEYLDDLGYERKADAPGTDRARCDIALVHATTKHTFVLDVGICQPDHEMTSVQTVPLTAAVQMAAVKTRRYTDAYDVPEADVIPLVFETYGGFAPSTLQFLKTISQAIGRDDAELAGQVFRGVRDRIAVALHKRQCAVIAQLNSLNAAFAQGR